MDPYTTKKFTKKFGSKVINRQYFHRKAGLKCSKLPNRPTVPKDVKIKIYVGSYN